MKHFLSVLMVAFLIVFSSSCSKQGNEKLDSANPVPMQQPPTWQQDTSPVKLTMTSQVTWSPESQDLAPVWGEDEVSRMIMNLTGVYLDMVQQGPDLALEVLLASDEVGDLVATRDQECIRILSDPSMSMDLNLLAKKYCPDLWDDVDPLQLMASQNEEGGIYSLNSYFYTEDVYNDPNVPILPTWSLVVQDAYCQNLPDSIEELEEWLYSLERVTPLAMEAAPLNSIPDWLGIHRDVYWDEEESCVRTPLRQSDWLEYLQMIARWYRDGAAVFCPEGQSMAEWVNETKPAAIFLNSQSAYSNAAPFLSTVTDKDPWPWTVITQPLTWRGEVRYAPSDRVMLRAFDQQYVGTGRSLSSSYYGFSSGSLFITDHCSNPERAIAFYHFLLSDDGAKLTHWGLKDIHYTQDTQGLITYLEPYRQNPGSNSGGLNIGNMACNPYGLRYWNFVPSAWADGVLLGSPVHQLTNPIHLKMRPQYIEAGLNNKPYLLKNRNAALIHAYPAAGSDDDFLYQSMIAYWEEEVQRIVTESRDSAEISQRWDTLCRELTTLGIDDLETRMTDRYEQALKRYQAEGYYTE